MALLVMVLLAGRAGAVVTSGLLLTNFTSATYALPSGSGVNDTDPGVSIINIPNSSSCWTLVTDSPQMCLALWKQAIDGTGALLAPPPSQYPGGAVCFQIGFSNCGGFTGFSVLVTDVMPANVVKGNNPPFSFWFSGGYGSIMPFWATSLDGPWNSTSNVGLVAPLYMRWLVGKIGMHKSGYIRYCVTIL